MVGCVLRAYRFLCLLVWAVGHINNLYNTTFWAMVQKGGMGTTEAEAELKVCQGSYRAMHSLLTVSSCELIVS